MRRALIRALLGLRRYPIVVVTDRYPPQAHGGAEVSLHICLSSLAERGQILVVKFDEAKRPTAYTLDGIRVLSLTRASNWPSQDKPARPHKRSTLLPAPTGSRVDEEDEAHRLIQLRPKGGLVVDHLEYEDNLGAAQLEFVLRHSGARLVHADNYRSIMLAAAAVKQLPALHLVGVVRDNRFHCVRHDQSSYVAGQACLRCNLECASEDLAESPDLQRAVIGKAAKKRRASLQRLDRVVVTSQYLRREISALVPEARIVVIANAPDDLALVRAYTDGIAEEPGTHVAVVGMLNENKGQIGLVQHLGRLVERIPDIVVHFAGRGARITRGLKQRAADQGLGERLLFHEYLDRQELYQLYAQCQIVVLPTRWPEPFGRVPLEAGAAGRPCVAFAVGGLKESIIDGRTGRLIEPENFDALIEAVGQLADNPRLARQMGHNARKHIAERYRRESLSLELYKVWQTSLGSLPSK